MLDSVLATTQIDLSPDDNDVSPITALLFQPRKLGAVLWACCKRQADETPITSESFKEALDGDVLAKGWEALVDAIVFFIQSRSPGVAEAVRAAVEAELRVMEAGASAMIATIKSNETDEALKQAAERIGAEMQSEMTKALDNYATS